MPLKKRSLYATLFLIDDSVVRIYLLIAAVLAAMCLY